MGKARQVGAELQDPPHPWGPDVDALAAEIGPSLTPGAVVPHGKITAVLGASPRGGGQRYYDVVGAWRRRVWRETGLVLRAVPTVGYEVLQPGGRVRYSGDLQRYGLRRVCRSVSIAATTPADGLTPDQRAARDHLLKIGGAQIAISRAAGKALDAAAMRKALNG